MFKKPGVYINIVLSLVIVAFVVNTFNLPGHTFVKKVMATVGAITGEGTITTLPRFVGASGLSNTIGSSIIYDDGANHVGVNTVAPGNLLTVNQTSNTTAATRGTYGFSLNISTAEQLTMGADATYAYLQSWGAKPLYINNQGNNVLFGANVGIGTADPDAKLQIGSNGATAMAANTDLWLDNDLRFSSGGDHDSSYGMYLKPGWTGSVSKLTIGGRHSGTDADVMTILRSGSIGIGTTAPLAQLEIQGAGSNGLGLNVSNVFVVNKTSGNVGIGTTSPGYLLDVQGTNPIIRSKISSGTAAYSAMFIENDSASHNWVMMAGGTTQAGTLFGVNKADIGLLYTNNMPIAFGTAGNFDLTLGTNSTANVTIKSGGNVGIGTTGPGAKLDVAGANYDSAQAILAQGSSAITDLAGAFPGFGIVNTNQTANNYAGFLFSDNAGGGNGAGGIYAVFTDHNNNYGDLAFLTRGSGTGTFSEKVRITSNGNVGIGTTAPEVKLQLYDATLSTTNVLQRITSGATGIAGLDLGNSGDTDIARIRYHNNEGYLGLGVGNSDTNLVLYNGNVGLGTTTFTSYDSNLFKIGNGGNPFEVQIPYGTMCLDSDGSCSSSSLSYGQIKAVSYATGNSDVAEYYKTTDVSLESGDLVMADQESSGLVKKSMSGMSESVLGVVSEKPGLEIGAPDELRNLASDMKPIALAGRVPVKVSEENGAIRIGDRLTASKTLAGYAMKMVESGQSIGIALANSSKSKDKISVFVNLGYANIGAPLNDLKEANAYIEQLNERVKILEAKLK